jgi:hypothetical protein
MNHQPYREWIELGIFDELSKEERHSLDEHIRSCVECRAEVKASKRLHTAVSKAKKFGVTDELLMEARQEFRAALRKERSGVSLWQQVNIAIDAVLAPPLKLAAGGAFMLAVGVLGGYFMFHSTNRNGNGLAQSMSSSTQLSRGESQITNVKFSDADPSDGVVAFSFDAVTPVEVKGSPGDPGIQSVLVKALAHEENPGTRLRAVSAITSPMVNIQFNKQEKEIVESLVNAMKYDENPAVRKEAIKALRKLPLDDTIKEGLLHVLSKDKNEGMRVEAINALTAVRGDVKSSDDKLMEILRKKAEFENNNYIRQRAKAVLQEVQR